jgi:hypothetical protein
MENEDQVVRVILFPVFFASVFKISGCVSSQTVVKNHPILSDVIFHQKTHFNVEGLFFKQLINAKNKDMLHQVS